MDFRDLESHSIAGISIWYLLSALLALTFSVRLFPLCLNEVATTLGLGLRSDRTYVAVPCRGILFTCRGLIIVESGGF